jgi:ABC-type phosphate/phosphonate transport system substrate-binding protein
LARASLPMYDLPELRWATDAWWAGLRRALVRHGFPDAPERLDREEAPAALWHDPSLLLSQCCGRDLVTHLAGTVRPVAIPSYAAPGCAPGLYRSWIVVRRAERRAALAEFAGATAAINGAGSHSGWVALGHALRAAGMPERCLARGVPTGSHPASLAAVAEGVADLAAIDCVSYALLARTEPGLVEAVRVLAGSEPAPALPYVTATSRPAEERGRLYAALVEAAADPALAAARAALLLEGLVAVPADAYDRSVAMAAAALREPCAKLG